MTKHKKSRLQRQSRTRRRSRSRSRHQRKRTMKRGGMMPNRAARTSIYHHVLPLFTQFNTKFGKVLTPEQKEVVLKGERYYRSVADFPVDGPLKASINKLKEEFSSTEQNAQKALDIYNKILQALEDAEKRQKENITQTPGRARDTFSSSSMYANSPLLFLQGTSYGSQSSPSPFANTPQNITNPHFNTPSKPNSTELTTPPRLRADEKGSQPITSDDDVTRINLFQNDENKTPPPSPGIFTPPRLSSKSAPRSPFSPSRPPFRLG